MEEGNAIKTLVLPEEVIQHIQSFMTGKEAARSAILSKSWYKAWLTRPAIDLDERDFTINRDGGQEFVRFARKTMQKYQDLNLKIKSFKLSMQNHDGIEDTSNELISNAMKLGATDVELDMPPHTSLNLQEVLRSESLVRLSLTGCEFVDDCVISSSRLKSLNLTNVIVSITVITSCCDSLEELSLSDCYCWSNPKLFGLHKLRRLYLDATSVKPLFFTDFASRFPCLKDLTILNMGDWKRIRITRNSLVTIIFKPYIKSYRATFDVPNIQKLTYSGIGIPSLSINGGSRKWEFDISIGCDRLYNEAWFKNLKKLLTNCISGIISLCINLYDVRHSSFEHDHAIEVNLYDVRHSSFEHDHGIEVGVEPLVVENFRIDAPPKIFFTLLLHLFRICRPRFITQYWLSDECDGWRCKNECLGILCKRLMQVRIAPNCGMPEHYLLRQFGLKKVKMEVYEEFDTKWLRLPLEKPLNASKAPVGKRKIRFELIWD